MKSYSKVFFAPRVGERMLIIVLVSLGCFAGRATALELPSIFSDHMVIQADQEVAVWGRAAPGSGVTVALGSEVSASAVADETSGKWRVNLPPVPAGGPHEMVLTAGEKTVRIADVLVGEVWLASGQSNMSWTMSQLRLSEEEHQAADFPEIRMFTARQTYSDEPLENAPGEWRIFHPDNAGRFSAVAYYFGRELYRGTKTPVGLVVSAYGGSTAEAWMSEASLRSNPDFAPILERLGPAEAAYPSNLKAFEQQTEEWRAAVEAARAAGDRIPRQPRQPQSLHRHKWPIGLYNGMLLPISSYSIRGVIWYQGESNAGRAHQYEALFPGLIANWRDLLEEEHLPFIYVQLANFRARADEPGESTWAELREAQRKALSVPNTAMAVAIDVGEAGDIHPKNKWDVGHRLAVAALATVYGHDIPYSGPMFKSMEIRDGTVRVAFDHVYDGLTIEGDRLEGFSLAGEDRKFAWAEAVIDGDEVVLQSSAIPDPVAVRYGWADNPSCNLYNSANLPASPFRSDDWPGITVGEL